MIFDLSNFLSALFGAASPCLILVGIYVRIETDIAVLKTDIAWIKKTLKGEM